MWLRIHTGWVGLKTLVAGLTKSKGGEGDIPSHVDDARCLSLVFSGNSAVRCLSPVRMPVSLTPRLLHVPGPSVALQLRPCVFIHGVNL